MHTAVVGIMCFMCVAALGLKIGETGSDSNVTTQLEAPAAVRRSQDRGGNYERPSSCDSEQCYGCRTNNYYVVQRRDHIGYAVCGDDCKEKADCPDWDNSQFCSPLDVCFLVCFEEWVGVMGVHDEEKSNFVFSGLPTWERLCQDRD
ncbi:hypothetical protein FOZ62_016237 [Perkinsus olseni]|uniref:Uncharacterized protein n=1 Tax=Perkinsus olseni TaxID=32597 RepID=A0A7J6TRJ6_PEROL|nr:hypothetical protein FOZ62_016237 [Perkinsus olseni]